MRAFSPLDKPTRLALLSISVLIFSFVCLALFVEPDPRGYGTHEKLGLPPCFFHLFSGLPCPLCGLTTSFIFMSRGHLSQAFTAHPLGPMLFASLVFMGLFCLFASLLGRGIRFRHGDSLVRRGSAVLVVVILITWVLRLSILFLANKPFS